MPNLNKKVLNHFRDRSAGYNRSSNWAGDQSLLDKIFALAAPRAEETVLDLATGTGLVAKQFRGKVRKLIGLDISPDMTSQAGAFIDRMIISPMEDIPLEPASVDLCVCRQGLQFVDLSKTLPEVVRVLKPGGRVVFCHLNAYQDEDREESFKIQSLRNPSRVNFFKPGDLESLLSRHGLSVTECQRHESRESVNQWIEHGASTEVERKAIRNAYRGASDAFRKLHKLEIASDDIFDTMLFLLIRAEKRA